MIVGIAFIREIRPPVATAPAPMYRMYRDHISLDDMSLISAVGSGDSTEVSPSPKNAIKGISITHDIKAPLTMTPDTLYPKIYPTPRRAGRRWKPILPFGKPGIAQLTLSLQNFPNDIRPLKIAPTPRPINTVLACEPPTSLATRTSAQAVPSGYGRTPCSFTIKNLRKGIMKRIPKSPPVKPITVMLKIDGSSPHKNRAGSVKIIPLARLELAEPTVWEMLCSRMVVLPKIGFTSLKKPTVITAIGTDVDTVIPTLRPR